MLRFIGCLLVLVTVTQGKPIISDTVEQQSLSDTAKHLQSIAHMAVVDSLSPLHVSLTSLETTFTNFVNIATENEYPIQDLDIPKIDVLSILTCKSRSSPKYSMVLEYIMDHKDQIQDHIINADKLADGLKYVAQLIMTKQISKDSMPVVCKEVSDYLTDYASTISDIKSTVCQDATSSAHPVTEMYMGTPLSVFLKGTMPTGGPVDKGFSLGGGGVGKGFAIGDGGVGKGFSLSGGGVGRSFALGGDDVDRGYGLTNIGGVDRGFSLGGGGVGKSFALGGGGVGKGFNLNGGGVDRGFSIGGSGVDKGFNLSGGGVGKNFNLNGGGVDKREVE